MVSIASLWLPILLSAVFVFFLSWIIHMFLPYHRTDYGKLPSEADLQEALRKFNIAPGDYLLPCPEGPTGMRSPEYLDKRNKGPVAVMTVMKSGLRAVHRGNVRLAVAAVERAGPRRRAA